MDWAKTTERRDEDHFNFGFGTSYIRDFTVLIIGEGNQPVIGGFTLTGVSNAENVSMPWRHDDLWDWSTDFLSTFAWDTTVTLQKYTSLILTW